MSKLRRIATPLTIGASLLMGATGVLMFFHAGSGTAKLAHEWVGLAFIAIIGLHVAVNLRPFTAHLRRPPARIAIAAFGALLAATFLPLDPGGGGRSDFALLHRVEAAPIGALGALLNENPVEMADRIRAAGYPTADLDSSILSLAGKDREAQMALIEVMLAPPAG